MMSIQIRNGIIERGLFLMVFVVLLQYVESKGFVQIEQDHDFL